MRAQDIVISMSQEAPVSEQRNVGEKGIGTVKRPNGEGKKKKKKIAPSIRRAHRRGIEQRQWLRPFGFLHGIQLGSSFRSHPYPSS